MSDCRKCAKFEECAVEEDCGLFVDKPMTNADIIRSMTDEELAEFLAKYRCAHKAPRCRESDCTQCWINWLKQEVGNG